MLPDGKPSAVDCPSASVCDLASSGVLELQPYNLASGADSVATWPCGVTFGGPGTCIDADGMSQELGDCGALQALGRGSRAGAAPGRGSRAGAAPGLWAGICAHWASLALGNCAEEVFLAPVDGSLANAGVSQAPGDWSHTGVEALSALFDGSHEVAYPVALGTRVSETASQGMETQDVGQNHDLDVRALDHVAE